MSPRFSAGEVVILQSVNYPQYSGEYEILKVLFYNDEFPDRLDETTTIICEGDIAYVFTKPLASCTQRGECIWAEQSLRKKHQPGEISFRSLMDTLKSPQIVEWE